jgi:hypothetical protein
MLRGLFSIAVAVATGCVLVGCSAGDGSQSATARAEQDTSVKCGSGNPVGGTMTVTLLDFDSRSLQVTAWSDAGLVRLQYTSDTVDLAADLNAYPPDPVYPCTSQAQTYNDAIGGGLTRAVLQSLAQQADFECNASITVAADGTITSFQPVP